MTEKQLDKATERFLNRYKRYLLKCWGTPCKYYNKYCILCKVWKQYRKTEKLISL